MPFRGLLTLAAFLVARQAGAQAFLADLSLDPDDLSVNRLTIQSSSPGGLSKLAYESAGVALGNRIELRLAPELRFTALALPPYWTTQSTIVEESSTAVQIITCFYEGGDPANPAESYNFVVPWSLEYRLLDPRADPADPLTVALSISIRASTRLPGFGLIPVGETYPGAATLSTPDSRQPFIHWVADNGAAPPALTFRQVLPGIAYRIESSEGLQSWTHRTTFTPAVKQADYVPLLPAAWKSREFFRVLLAPVRPGA